MLFILLKFIFNSRVTFMPVYTYFALVVMAAGLSRKEN